MYTVLILILGLIVTERRLFCNGKPVNARLLKATEAIVTRTEENSYIQRYSNCETDNNLIS